MHSSFTPRKETSSPLWHSFVPIEKVMDVFEISAAATMSRLLGIFSKRLSAATRIVESIEQFMEFQLECALKKK